MYHIVQFYNSQGNRQKNPDIARAERARKDYVRVARALRGSAVVVSAVDLSTEDNPSRFFPEGSAPSRDALPLVRIYSPDGSSDDFSKPLKKLASTVLGSISKTVSDDLARLMPVLVPKQKTYKAFKKQKDLAKAVLLFETKGKSKTRQQIYDTVAALALHFDGRLRFGFSKHKRITKRVFGLEDQLPALVVIPKGQKMSSYRVYKGKLAYRPLRAWLSQFADPAEALPAAVPAQKAVDTIPQIKSEGCMQAYCTSRGGFCVLLLVPDRSLSVAEKGYFFDSMRLVRRSLFDKLGMAAANGMHFAWVDSGRHRDWIQDTFGLPPAEYARAVVWYPKKGVFSQFVGALEPAEVAQWLTSASRGKASVDPMESENVLEFALDEAEPPYTDSTDCSELTGAPLPDEVTQDAKGGRARSSEQPGGGGTSTADDGASSTKSSLGEQILRTKRFPRPRGKAGRSYALSAGEFDNNVLRTNANWLVWFQGEQRPADADVKAWERAAKSLKGMVQFGVVESGSAGAEILSQQGFSYDGKASMVRMYPADILREAGATKAEASKWLDDFEFDTGAITERALGMLSAPGDNDRVVKVNEASFNGWFTQDTMMNLRFILFPSKDLDTTPYLLKALALEYPGLVLVGLAKRSEEAFAQSLGVKKYPSLIIVTAQGAPDDKGRMSIGAHMFEGSLSFNSVCRFVETNVRVQAPPPEEQPKDEL